MHTVFHDVIGDMNVVPIFGPSFTVYSFYVNNKVLLPLLLILMCIFNLFKLGTKLMDAVGLSGYAGKEEKEGMGEEGKRILLRGKIVKIKDLERDAINRIKDSRPNQ